MRMITRCPHCGTAFRIEPAQLEARDGHVRCGRCKTVFDARATLVTELDLGPPVPAGAAPAPEPALAEARAPEVESAATPVAQSAPATVIEHAPAPAAESAPTPAIESEPAPPVAPEPARVEAALAHPRAPLQPHHPVEADEAPLEFGPRVRRAARLRAALWGLAALAAALALAAQVLYAYRGEAAVLAPAARPWLEAACAQLGCTVPLPRHAHLISIESSELHAERDAPDVVTLSAVLRNRAVFGQALPALELTLTDAYDRPVARRVLRPRDYLGETADREPIFPPNAEHAFKLHLDVAGLNASGYRIFVFYL